MLPEQLDLLVGVGRPAIHRDGWAVVATSRPDFDANAYVGQLWRVAAGEQPYRITRGFHDSAPQISPDGKLIAFLRATPDNPPQLAVMPAEGGEPMVITDRKLGVEEYCFTLDSRQIVFTSREPEPGRYGTTDGVSAAAEDPRRITTLTFDENDLGYLIDKRVQVFIVDAPDPRSEPPVKPVGRAKSDAPLVPPARQLTSGDYDHNHPVAGEGCVIVQSARHETRDRDFRIDLYRIGLDDAPEPALVTQAANLCCVDHVVIGDTVYLLAQDMGTSLRDYVVANPAVYKVPVAGGTAQRLTDPADTEFIDLAADPVTGQLIGVVESRGAGVAFDVSPNGAMTQIAAPDDANVREVGVCNGVIMASVTTPDSPGEVAVLGASPNLISDFGAKLRQAATPIHPIELVATSPDGYPVHGWVFVPAGDGPHPVLLNIHGGPYGTYGPSFFDEPQVYAGAGYAVVMCNPRGSSSYGEAHGRAILDDFGNLDMADILAFLDHALEAVPGLDATRVGVLGGSYGGYMTAWIIAHDHRWKGAIVERAYLDPRSFVGASDIGWWFAAACNTDDSERMDAQSPLLLTGQVTTPTLVLHSENDLRCPIGPARRYYAELKLLGQDVEMMVFPGESHELSRSGLPWHRRQRFDAILDWWARKL